MPHATGAPLPVAQPAGVLRQRGAGVGPAVERVEGEREALLVEPMGVDAQGLGLGGEVATLACEDEAQLDEIVLGHEGFPVWSGCVDWTQSPAKGRGDVGAGPRRGPGGRTLGGRAGMTPNPSDAPRDRGAEHGQGSPRRAESRESATVS